MDKRERAQPGGEGRQQKGRREPGCRARGEGDSEGDVGGCWAAGRGRPLVSGDGVEVLGGSGVAGARGSLGADALADVGREATQMIKGTERLISEGRLKGLSTYIAWLRAVHGETN